MYVATIEEELKAYRQKTGHAPGIIEISSVDYERILKEILHTASAPIKVLTIAGVNVIPDESVSEGSIRHIDT